MIEGIDIPEALDRSIPGECIRNVLHHLLIPDANRQGVRIFAVNLLVRGRQQYLDDAHVFSFPWLISAYLGFLPDRRYDVRGAGRVERRPQGRE